MASADYLRYLNQNATRNKPLSPKLVDALAFLPELGVQAEVFSGGQDAINEGGRRTGSIRHDHGDAGDVFFTREGRRLDWANPEDQPIFEEIVRRGKANGITGMGAGPGYMQPGSMHIGFGSNSVWGAGGKRANAPDWLVSAYEGAPAPEQTADSGGDTTLIGGAGDDTMAQYAPPTNPGGLGGLGGFLQSDILGDIFTSFGRSMLESPGNAPLTGFGAAMSDTQDRRLKRQLVEQAQAEKDAEKQALELALRSQGFDADQARAYSLSPSAANVAIAGQDQRRKQTIIERDQNRDRAYLSGISGIVGGTGTPAADPYAASADEAPLLSGSSSTPAAPPPPRGGPASPRQKPNTATLTTAIRAADDVISSEGFADAPGPASTSFATGNGTVDGLMVKRSKLAAVLANAPSDDAFQRGKVALDQIDKEIETYSPTGAVKEYTFAMNQRTAEGLPVVRYEVWKADQSKAGAASVVVGAEKSYDQTIGKGYGDRFLEIQKEGQSAASGLGALDVMQKAMANDSFYSGFGAEQLLTARRAAAAVGLDPEGISDMETFSAQTKGAALAAMGGSLGAGFSNADRSFVEGQVPALENTPEGNRKLIDINRRLYKRKQEIASFARDYAKRNGGRLDLGFDDALADWAAEKPLFPDEPISGVGGGASGGGGGGYKVRSVR